MANAAAFQIADVARSFSDLKQLAAHDLDLSLLSRLVVINRQVSGSGGLHKGNLLLPGDPYGLAAGFADSEKMEVQRYLLGSPWARLVDGGFLVDAGGNQFFTVTPRAMDALTAKDEAVSAETKRPTLPSVETSEEEADPLEVDNDTESDETIIRPFDPTKIRVETRQLSVDTLVSRMINNEITLQPDFQRNEVWREGARSRLIESILIRIPLPAFYMDATDEETWLVVDGQQRLSTLRRFIIEKSLRLRGLEFLKELDGFTFDELPRTYQRRIKETNVTVYLIERGTPSQVKINIFKRINTGGLPLSAQEIRHALNGGPITAMLKELALSQEFLDATRGGVPSDRMSDREFVIRFFAFVLVPPSEYNAQEFDSFLSDIMSRINKLSEDERSALRQRFLRAMQLSKEVLDKYAFRKRFTDDEHERLKPVNKALFEAWSVNLDALSDDEAKLLIARKSQIWPRFVLLMEQRPFEQAISQGTGDIQKVKLRFGAIQQLIRAVLDC